MPDDLNRKMCRIYEIRIPERIMPHDRYIVYRLIIVEAGMKRKRVPNGGFL